MKGLRVRENSRLGAQEAGRMRAGRGRGEGLSSHEGMLTGGVPGRVWDPSSGWWGFQKRTVQRKMEARAGRWFSRLPFRDERKTPRTRPWG